MTLALVVDDEASILRVLVMNLRRRGFEVTTAETGAAALELAGQRAPDLVVLDLGLPDLDGLEVIRRLRARGPLMPIIVLSARTTSHDKVAALDLGAVDYVTKPFDMHELVARLHAAVRRFDVELPAAVVTFGRVRVDLDARIVVRGQREERQEVHLTPNEWRMLERLMLHPGVLVSSDELLTSLRGDPRHTESSYLRIYMSQLRRKLEAVPSEPRHLLTEPGAGYRFQP